MILEEMLHSFPLRAGRRHGVGPLHFLHYRVCSLGESMETRRRKDAPGKEDVLYMPAIQSLTGKRHS